MEAAVEVKAAYYLQAEQYEAVVKAWKVLADNRSIESADIVIYNILRGAPASRGFIERKTNVQGNDPWFAFEQSKARARYILGKTDMFFSRFGIIAPAGLESLVKSASHE